MSQERRLTLAVPGRLRSGKAGFQLPQGVVTVKDEIHHAAMSGGDVLGHLRHTLAGAALQLTCIASMTRNPCPTRTAAATPRSAPKANL